MDRELTASERRRRTLRRAVPATAVAALAISGLAALPALLVPRIDRDAVRLARVDRGEVTSVLEAAGIVVPASERVIASPIDARLLRVLRRPGETVQAGDALVELDVAAASVELARLADRVAALRLDGRQAVLTASRELDDLRGRTESRRLERDVSGARLQRAERLRTEGLISDEALDERRLEHRRAEIDVAALDRAVAAQAAESQARASALQLQLDQALRDEDEQRRQLALARAAAEEAGVVTWVLDQPGIAVRRGEAVARVARLDAFAVRASVSDTAAQRVRTGMDVRVRGAGFEIPGRVAVVHPSVAGGTLTFDVALEAADPALRPNLRVDAWVVGERRAGVLRLPRDGSASRGRVFVVRGDVARPRDVVLGLRGPDAVEVRSGLSEGDEVIVSDMSEHESADRVRLR